MTTTQNESQAIPEYQQANLDAEALFKSLSIVCKISEPAGIVKDGNWPCIKYGMAFSSSDNLFFFHTDYHLGIGHVNWKKYDLNKRFPFPPRAPVVHMIGAMQKRPRANYIDKALQAEAASYLAKIQKVEPKPYEVFAYICRDGLEASQNSFQDWAENFGYDSDSIKAKSIYDACLNQWFNARKLVNLADAERLAELASKF